MTDLGDFRRLVHEPVQNSLRLRQQDIRGCEEVFDTLEVPARANDGDLLRPTGRARRLLKRVEALERIAERARAHVYHDSTLRAELEDLDAAPWGKWA